MLTKIKDFFEQHLVAKEEVQTQTATPMQLCTAALLIEVSRADHSIDQRETDTLINTLKAQFKLNDNDLNELVTLAEEESNEAIDLYQFTRLANEHYNYAEKIELVEDMWRIAFADGNVDKYEDYVIRKVSELMYVPHSDFIKAKLTVQPS